MSNKTIRVGLIGAGGNTRSRHIPGLKEQKGVELAAVANRTTASGRRIADQFGVAKVCGHWREILEDASIDATLIVAGWQYLQQPEPIAAELWRITRPRGQVIVAFSNRMFFTKAPQVWTDGDDGDHLRYVAEVLMAQGWPQPEDVAEDTRAEGVMGLFGGKGDPFFAVVAEKPLQ